MTRRTFRTLAASLALLAAATTDNRADTLTRKDGKQFEGRVVEETPTHVTFESNSGGITLRMKVGRANIASIEKQVVEGVGYCTIPIKGAIGTEVTAAALRGAIAEARRAGAQYVILQIDSLGGRVAEMYEIGRVIAEARDLKFVAHVQKQAMSAAAIISLACPHIVMAPDAIIGAAVVYKPGKNGVPESVSEKFQSFNRGQERAIAETGGHSDLWARGMTEMDLELYLARDGEGGRGRPAEGPAPEGSKVLKKKGQIITLTASEALDAGLSEATVRDVDEIRELLGVKVWHNAGNAAESLMAARTKVKGQETAARDERIKQLKGDLEEVDGKLQRTTEEIKTAERAIVDLRRQYEAEMATMKAEYDRDFQAAMSRGGVAPLRVQEAAQGKAKACRARYEGLINEKLAVQQSAMARGRDLIVQRSKLITAALPAD
jgi:ATP-dependent protease ClpP protease subunit